MTERFLLSHFAVEDGIAFSTARAKRVLSGLGTLTPSGWMVTRTEWKKIRKFKIQVRLKEPAK